MFGNPIKHSQSPKIHSAFAAQTGQAMNYSRQYVPLGQFKAAAGQFFADGGKGLNITLPFKIDAYHYAQELTKRAQQAGAVNTLIAKDKKIVGDNTDGVGLLSDMRYQLNWRVNGTRILVMGAGGAVRGVLAPLLNEQPSRLIIVNRDKFKAEKLIQLFSHSANADSCGFYSYQGLHDALLNGKKRTHDGEQAFDIIINGTSSSLNNELPPISDQVIHAGSYCYDMAYGAELTVFLQWAQRREAAGLSDGIGMLVCQAAESFYQWRGIRPDVRPVIQQLRSELCSDSAKLLKT